MNSGKVLLGLLAGFTAGTLLGMLFASNNCDTENKSSFWGKDKDEDDTDEKLNEFIEDITEKFADLKKEIIVEQARSKAK